MVELSNIIDGFPSINPRELSSTFAQYIAAFQDETDSYEQDLNDIRESHFIDLATGGELDEIGKQYGVIGKRAGRSDAAYRIYLKGLVETFSYNGTVPGIKAAISSGLGIEDTDVEVYEHFNDDPVNDYEYLEYTITLNEWPEHDGSTVETLAELSDASMSRLRKTTYPIDGEDMGSDDAVTIQQGENILEDMAADDAVVVDGNKTTVADEMASDDGVVVDEVTTATWGSVEWDYFEWE